jgi:hypothetical protein
LSAVCKLIAGWTARGPEYVAAAKLLLEEEREIIGQLSMDRQMSMVASVGLQSTLPDIGAQRYDSSPITEYVLKMGACATRLEEGGLAQQSLITQTCFM